MDGYNITLTIDTTIQSYLEKTLEEGIKDFDIRDGAFAIAMNPQGRGQYDSLKHRSRLIPGVDGPVAPLGMAAGWAKTAFMTTLRRLE